MCAITTLRYWSRNFKFFSTPFAVEIDNRGIANGVELQRDSILKQKYAEIGIPDFFYEKGFRGYSLLLRGLLQCLEVHMNLWTYFVIHEG